jgi:hypothetical protein
MKRFPRPPTTSPPNSRKTTRQPACKSGASRSKPGKVLERPDAVIVTLAGRQPPPLPKGLPVLPDDLITVFLVYIANKQWQKVAAAMQNPEDRLVIEGYPFMDPKLKVIGVLTQNVTTVTFWANTE